MKKILFALMAIVMLGNACKKESTEDVTKKEPAHKNLLLKRTSNDGLTYNYTYDANNKLINYTRTANQYNPSQDIKFSYNSNGSLAEIIDNGSTRTAYSYNSDGTLSKKMEYNGIGASGTLVNSYLYSYSGGVVTENYVFIPTGAGWKTVNTYDPKGNLIELKSYTTTSTDPVGTLSTTITYKNYDDKFNYRSSLPKEFFFPKSTVNNMGTLTDSWGTTTYTHEYNADGYPTKISDGYNTDTFEYKRL